MRSVLGPLIVVCLLAVGWVGCQSSAPWHRTELNRLPPSSPGAGNTSEVSREQRSGAIQLYTIKCARCHKFYNPADYSEEEWRGWMTKMSRKAHLKPGEADLLSRYLETFRPEQKNH